LPVSRYEYDASEEADPWTPECALDIADYLRHSVAAVDADDEYGHDQI